MRINLNQKFWIAVICFPVVLSHAPVTLASSLDALDYRITDLNNVGANVIKGVVIDSNGLPIIGANVVEKGTTNGVITDLGGNFELQVSLGSVLQISYIGYISQEIKISQDMNREKLKVVLEEDSKALDEIVVVGYGVMKKSDLTGAVSSVDSEKLNTMPASNAIEALQGKIAGVEIGAATEPGVSPNILIRGNRSINASNTPLYVVDGIPRDEINDIPVSDIESIEVLKDAASTAIYGSRGANGVIMVSTKKGKVAQKTEVSFGMHIGVNQAKMPKMISGDDYVQYRRDVARITQNGGWEEGYPSDDIVFALDGENALDIIKNRRYADWQDLIYRDGINQEYNLNVSSGTEKTQFAVSLGYRKEEGYYKTNDYDRINGKVSIDHKLNKYISFGLNSRITNTTNSGATKVGGINLVYVDPIAQPFDEDGNLVYKVGQNNTWNLLANYYEPYKNSTNTFRSFNIGYIDINILKGLKLRSNVGIDIANTGYERFYGKNSFDGNGQKNYGERKHTLEKNFTWDNILTYLFEKNKHSLNATLVSSMQKSVTSYEDASGESIPIEDLLDWNLQAATENIKIASGYEKWSLLSFLCRFQYGFDSRYLFNFAFRADGSSVLADGNKWGYFPTVSTAWVISREKFFKIRWINNLKVRASYGIVGNSAIDPYQTFSGTSQTTYNFGDVYYYGYKLGSIANKDLGWEYSSNYNIGIDFGILNNRISGSVEYYVTNTRDLLLKRNIPMINGSAEIWQNIGKTRNRGVEVAINSVNIDMKNFRWETDFNFYKNKEEITSLIEKEDMVGSNLFIGHPVNVIYDYEKIGIWQANEKEEALIYNANVGDLKFKDQNPEDGKAIDADHDKIILGQKTPKWSMFMRNSFNFYNFNLSFAIEGKFGHMLESEALGKNIFLNGTRYIPQAVYGNYWTPDNPTNEYPSIRLEGPIDNIEVMGYRKASYLNLQEITLGYTFDKLSFMRNFNIYVNVKNPFYLWRADKDIDPQAPNYDISAYRTYVVGFNINF
ncbi:TonB-dependent receptor [Phocaeicola sp. Sa1CVN1]|uniref:TonB-dependent receptor n=1 Tax=Phocaeicola intestinalis TaxID=2762212 RepID=A0ABR8Y7H8_9BACT|nr:TonB-dependent receptor [Phocaeicola intestinalis]MBD8040076.1 TonB-dependent receptor [Phocaeicola intestinalis]